MAPYETWAFIPIIKHIDHPNYGEIKKKKDDKRKILEFRLKIDHAEFKAADRKCKEILLLDALDRSVNLMSHFGVSTEDRESLHKVLEKVKLMD